MTLLEKEPVKRVEKSIKQYNSEMCVIVLDSSAKTAIEAGANILVSGTTIFKSNNGNIKKNIELLKSI